MQEIWKDVKGYEEYYQISNKGNCKSKDRHLINGFGRILKKGKTLKQIDNGKGYKYIYLFKNKVKVKAYIHRLVAMNFINNPLNKPEVNHIDSNPSNNSLYNLEWVTRKENMNHAIKKGRFDNHYVKLRIALKKATDKLKKPIYSINVKTGEKINYEYLNITKEYGFTPGLVCSCLKGKQKTHKGHKFYYEEKE